MMMIGNRGRSLGLLTIGLIGLQIGCTAAPRSNAGVAASDLAEPVSARTPATHPPRPEKVVFVQTGMASFIADEMHGKPTASGEMYNMRSLVAAHPTLPFGTRVRVTSLTNGKNTVVRINDRGPFVKDRIIDLSFEAAKTLGFVTKGVELVEIRVLQMP